jgi:organic hydroperoxide reductase OsmC/OhrA
LRSAADERVVVTRQHTPGRIEDGEDEGDKRPTAVEVETLHHESHEACYIANSVKTEILIEGQAESLL